MHSRPANSGDQGGKASGGHLNPAISLAMWRFGTFPGWGVLPYVAAQLTGSLLGVLLARAAWGSSVADPPVAYAALRPAPGWSAALSAQRLPGLAP
jgi:glycerol uptake facilitator-like aquaporin